MLCDCCPPHLSAGATELGAEGSCHRKHGWKPATSRHKDEKLLTGNLRDKQGWSHKIIDGAIHAEKGILYHPYFKTYQDANEIHFRL